MLNTLTEISVLGNTLLVWLISLATFLFVLAALLVVRGLVGTRLAGYTERNGAKLGASPIKLVKKTHTLFILTAALYFAALPLSLPDELTSFILITGIVVLLIQTGIWVSSMLSMIIARRKEEQLADEAGSVTTLNAVELVGRVVIWTLVLLLALDNIPGIQVTALIASLGVGGIAIGLALQNILGDLFASLSIALDKPFVIGDHINVGEFSGNVEYIGLKSTRLRSISGEQVVFSNSDLLKSRIRNFKRMARRRIVFPIQVTYNTPPEMLRLIPDMIRAVIEAQENTTFDRAHLKALGEYSLEFEAVYYMEIPDYMIYMDTQQAINLQLFDCFAQQGIEFAYPTQKVLVERPA
jgi:small-conductance mechanosensitive channel